MNILEKIKSLFTSTEDSAEWAPNNPGGDESKYDGTDVAYAPFDYMQFKEETYAND